MKTVITTANELIEKYGKDYAIRYFQDKIDDMGNPKDFSELCKQSGWETAIKYIKDKIKN